MTDTLQGSLTPDEAFALVGHETRITILRAVMDAAREADDPNTPVSFSELRERAGGRTRGGSTTTSANWWRRSSTTTRTATGSGTPRCW